MAMRTLGALRGFPGIFMAGILAATLSTLSSGLNSAALLILKDGLELAYELRNNRKMSDAFATKLAMLISKIFQIEYHKTW